MYLDTLNNFMSRTTVVGDATSLVWFRALPRSVIRSGRGTGRGKMERD